MEVRGHGLSDKPRDGYGDSKYDGRRFDQIRLYPISSV